MKTNILTVTVMLLLGLAKGGAVGAVGFPGFAMGSTNIVADYCAQNSFNMNIFMYQNTIVGAKPIGDYRSEARLNFASKAQLDAFFLQKVQAIAQMAITNTQPFVDQFLPFTFYGWTQGYVEGYGVINFLHLPSVNFTLIHSNGTHYVPDLSGNKMGFFDEIGYRIPNLRWGRVEILSVASNSKTVFDPLVNSSDSYYVDLANKRMFIPTSAALSGTTGSSRVKISLVSGSSKTFQCFGSMGTQIPEVLPVITSLKLPVNGFGALNAGSGEVGRFYLVLSGPTPQGPWVVSGGDQVMPPLQILGYTVSAPIGSNQFFRLRSTNAVPVSY